MISTWQTEGGLSWVEAIAVNKDYSGAKVRRLAKRTKDATQARRLLAVAAILDGASREEAAKTVVWTARR